VGSAILFPELTSVYVGHTAHYLELGSRKSSSVVKVQLHSTEGNLGHIFPWALLSFFLSFDNTLDFPFDFTEDSEILSFIRIVHLRYS
jgi:hypothetical protein